MNIKELEQRNLEVLAEELHKLYRAAFKALHESALNTNVWGNRCEGGHDHGWDHCNKKRYFLNRARILQENMIPPAWKTTGINWATVEFDEPGTRAVVHGAGCDDVYVTHEESKP